MQDAGAAPRRVRLHRAPCGAARAPLSQALISSRRCSCRRAEITVDPLVGRIATHFAYVAQAEGMDVFLSQQLARRTSGGRALFLAARFAASADARCADAGAARASPSRYSTAPGSLPVSPAGEAAGGAAGRGPSASRRAGSGGARKAAPRGRRTLAAEPSASPAPPERDAFTTPFPAAGGAPSPVEASADRPPPLFWLGGAGAAEAPAAEEHAPYDEQPYDDDFGGGGAFEDAPPDDEFAAMPADADAAEDAEVPDAEAPAVELPSAEAPPAAGRAAVPAVTGEASSFHVQCGQGPPADGDDDAVASGGKRGKAAAAARLQRASTATPKTAAARARAPPPPLFASPAVAGTPGDAPKRAVRAARQDWACAVCTLENPITVQRCNACNTRRGMSPPTAAEPAAARTGPSASKRGREATTPRGGSGAGGMPPPPSTAKRQRGGEDGEKENAAAPATGGKGSRARAASEAPTPRGAAAAAAIAAVTPATVKRSAPKTPAEALGGGWPAVARTWVLSPSGLNADQKTVSRKRRASRINHRL